ncbi:hypothetical protein GF337_18210, partial [candidate division KSB1 bacterium]|nr:hypothetical protein [candidate division KSB1 bacterium]
MKNTRIYILLFFCILMNSLAAQTGSELKRKYEITINRLEFARDVQVSFPNPNAGVLLAEAEKVLQKARMLFESRRFLMANRELDKANRLIINAVRLILTNPIKSQRKKLKERLLIAEKIVSDSRNRKAERSLSKAREHDKKAVAALRKNKYQLALEHIRLGIFMANQAIETAKNQNQNIREKMLEEKKRLDQLMQKAKDAVDNSQNPTASKLFQLAEKRLRKIRQLIDNNNYSQAIDQYHQLTRLLLRIIDIANGAGQKSELSIYEDVVRLDEMIENVSEQISERNLQDNQRV